MLLQPGFGCSPMVYVRQVFNVAHLKEELQFKFLKNYKYFPPPASTTASNLYVRAITVVFPKGSKYEELP